MADVFKVIADRLKVIKSGKNYLYQASDLELLLNKVFEEDPLKVDRENAEALYFVNYFEEPMLDELPEQLQVPAFKVAMELGANRAIILLHAALCSSGYMVHIREQITKQTLDTLDLIQSEDKLEIIIGALYERSTALLERKRKSDEFIEIDDLIDKAIANISA